MEKFPSMFSAYCQHYALVPKLTGRFVLIFAEKYGHYEPLKS